jgi:hypothetical protein
MHRYRLYVAYIGLSGARLAKSAKTRQLAGYIIRKLILEGIPTSIRKTMVASTLHRSLATPSLGSCIAFSQCLCRSLKHVPLKASRNSLLANSAFVSVPQIRASVTR